MAQLIYLGLGHCQNNIQKIYKILIRFLPTLMIPRINNKCMIKEIIQFEVQAIKPAVKKEPSQQVMEFTCQVDDDDFKEQLFQARQSIFLALPSIFNHTVIPTLGHTFIVHSTSYWKQKVDPSVMHFSHDGTLLKKLQIQPLVPKCIFCMTEHETAVWAADQQNRIGYLIQWDLITNKKIKLKYGEYSEKNQPCVLAFSETKLICIIEQNSNKENQPSAISLVYFQFPLKTQTDKPAFEFLFKGHDLQPDSQLLKINNHSGILWCSRRNRSLINTFAFSIFDLRSESKKIDKYQIKYAFDKNKEVFAGCIKQIWQPKHGQIYLRYSLEPDIGQFFKNRQGSLREFGVIEQKLLEEEETCHLICNYKSNSCYPMKISTKVRYKKFVVQFTDSFRLIENNFQDAYKIPTYSEVKYVAGLPRYYELPTFYVNFQTKKLLAIYNGQPGLLMFRGARNRSTFHPHYDGTMEVATSWGKKQGEIGVNLLYKKLRSLKFPLQIVSVFMLTELIEECDEDLLYYVANITQNQSWPDSDKNLQWAQINIKQGPAEQNLPILISKQPQIEVIEVIRFNE